MKITKYICDKCGKEIDEILEMSINAFDLECDGCVIDLPDDRMDEVLKVTEDKHLCWNCAIRGLRMAYTPVATVNEDFEREVVKMINEVSPEQEAKLKEEMKNAPVTVMPAEQPSVEVVGNDWCNLTKEVLEPMCAAGMTVQEMADKTGYKYMQIWRKLKRYGLTAATAEEKRQTSSEPAVQPEPIAEPEPEPEPIAEQEAVTESIPEPEPAEFEEVEPTKGLTLENVKILYVREGKNIPDIAKELDVPVDDVRRFIVKNRIFKNKELRNKYDRHAIPSEFKVGC